MEFVVIFSNDHCIDGISGADGYVGHNEDKNVLLDVPRTRI
jgi:hypothetical protein